MSWPDREDTGGDSRDSREGCVVTMCVLSSFYFSLSYIESADLLPSFPPSVLPRSPALYLQPREPGGPARGPARGPGLPDTLLLLTDLQQTVGGLRKHNRSYQVIYWATCSQTPPGW